MTKIRWRAVGVALLATLFGAAPGTAEVGEHATENTATRVYTASIDGAAFRVEVPARWNRTLVLYSHPKLRQLWAGRATHCASSAAEEIVMMRALFERVETGRWPSLRPERLNVQATRFAEPFHKVFDFATFQDLPQPPAFTRFSPGHLPRPAR